jgi:hypothetical protein
VRDLDGMGRRLAARVLEKPLSRRQAVAVGAASAIGLQWPFGAARGATAQAISTATSVSTTITDVDKGTYFAETGHNLREPFLSRWQQSGGQKTLGLPLSEERFQEKTGVLQTFEAVSIVYDPSLDAPWDLQSTHLPSDLVSALIPAAAGKAVTGCAANAATCQFFEQTGHTISGRIATFWNASGDLPIFGLPLSEPFLESDSGLTIQVFERAVLEDRGAGGVVVRAIAKQLADQAGLATDPAFVPAPPTNGTTKLVQSPDGLRVRAAASADGNIVVVLDDNAEFTAVAGTESQAWVPGYADGYSGWVSSQYLKDSPPIPALSLKDWDPSIWQGIALSETNVRAKPNTQSGIVEVLEYGTQLTVPKWVAGEEVYTGASAWAQIGDGKYVFSRNVGRNAPVAAPPLPAGAPSTGNWIDVHLTQQLMTAYTDRSVVRVSVMASGVPGWDTPEGTYQILVRVPNETMTSGAIGAEYFYRLDDVLFTQYFTDVGHAIHFAWWRTPETIGRPASHGCLNLLLDDSRFYWDWADIGTTLFIHY